MTANPPSGRRLTVAHVLPFQGIGGVEIATFRLVEATRDEIHHKPTSNELQSELNPGLACGPLSLPGQGYGAPSGASLENQRSSKVQFQRICYPVRLSEE